MDHDKAIRAAKLTLGGMLEKRRAEEAKQRAPGQIAPSKYLPGVPRAAHASGGYVPMANLPVARLAVAKPSVYSQQPTAMDALSSLASIGKTVKGFSDTISGDEAPPQPQPHAGRAEPHAGGLTPEATAAMEALRKGWSGDEFGIVSGYRTPEENRAAKGAKDSQHTHGNAYDVDTTGWTPEQKLALADEAWNAGFRGFGFYDNNMHFDVADPRAWGPSYSRDSIPEWALPWAQERYGYADGGPVASNDNFQSWFGNSVTHTDGEPHVFYTGTSKDKDFTSFNVGRHGAWFTRDPQVASSYAEQNDSQGYKRDGWNMVKTNTASRVIPAYVRAENPYTGELPPEFMRDNYKAAQSDWFDTLRAKGHDAWMPASQGGNLLVALKEPHQIKSIYNSGKFDPKQKHMNKADGGAVATRTKDGSEIFGNGALIHRYTHPETGGYIDVLQRSNGPASVLGLEVPEEHRGKGIGQMLQAEAMERHPALMGQVSSKAAATTAYRLGRRPYSAPDATLDDVFSAIDRDSSVNMLSPQAQPKADGGSVNVPQRTVKAYKLFRTKGDGKLYPLFVNAEKPVPMGEWLEAEEGPQGKAQGKVKSKLGDLAYRPGWHAGDLPMATHIGGKSDPSLKKPDYRPDNHVWAEVEMAADKDWQSVADSRGRGVKAHITDQVPLGGFYRYKTNPNMTGNWLIGGNMKVNRVLPDEEVKAINDQAGTADLPRLPRGAFAAGGAAMFEGMHEDLQNEDGTPMDLWHGTPSEPFNEFKDEKLGSTRDYGFYGRGHYLTPDRESAEEYTTNEYEKPGAVMGPLHAALKNPYVWDASEQGSHRTLRDLQSMGIMKGQAKLEPWDNLQGHHIRPFMDEMKKRGHDGVLMKTGRGVQEVVVFKPTAIKHRDAERFDPNDPNIYRANGGAIK